MTEEERSRLFLEEVNIISAKYGAKIEPQIQMGQNIDPMLSAIVGMLVSAGKIQAGLGVSLTPGWKDEAERPANSDATPPNPRRRKR